MDSRLTAFTKETEKVLQFLQSEFSKLQTGRANASLVEHLDIEAYGQKQELRSLASIAIQDARTLTIQPWDRSILGNIEKAFHYLDLGASCVNDGVVIRINLPPMTEERREQLVKIVHTLAEDARVSVRQARQMAHDSIKQEKVEDVRYTLEEELQKAVNEANATIDETREKKEKEVMNV
ncbi:ribosome recycling factor [Candidatus Peribacteria bacterium RIFCSPHIGHO2_02_FULL_49_16]|nr:MAG: ribosome recycling factor [Candidatus Peribacteria bacterium RIFCSPHIGHO2_01_FULL_49_38]OGJ58967.1 MAG: ribosome recycling factor [Candidatus Peribacteria bacterium RIFCSPHIGHO2_02_FULL_49_16]